MSGSHEHEATRTHTCGRHTHTLTGSETVHAHTVSAGLSGCWHFPFFAYKVIIIILVGVTEQGSIHCHCQPPINIPPFQGNPRSSRNLQFTQLSSMWTKPVILSLSLFFLPLSFPVLALHFPITSPVCLPHCVYNKLAFMSLPYLLSPAFLPHGIFAIIPSLRRLWPPTPRCLFSLLFCADR